MYFYGGIVLQTKIVENLNKVIFVSLVLLSLSCCVSEALARNCARISIVLTLLCCFLEPAMLKRLYKFKKILAATVIFYTSIFLSALYGGNLSELMNINSFYLQYHFLLVVVCILNIKRKKDVYTLLCCMFFSMLVSDIYIINQSINGVFRPVPLVMKAVIVGTMLYMITIPAMLTLCHDTSVDMKTKSFVLVCLLVSLLGVVCTNTRGGWLALFPVLICMLLYFAKSWKNRAIVLLMVALVSSVTMYVVPNTFSRVNSIVHSEKEQSATERYLMWESAYRMGMDNFFMGVGKGNYADKYQKEYISPSAKEPTQTHAHNNFLQLFAEGGIVGFVSYCGMLVVFFMWGWKYRKNTFGIIFLSSTTALVLYGVTDHTLPIYSALRVYWLLMGVCLSGCCMAKA